MFVTMTAPMGMQPAQQYSEARLKIYGRDALNVLSAEGKLQDIQDISALDDDLRSLLPENVGYNIVIYDGAGNIVLDTNRMPAPNAIVVYHIN